MQPLRSLTRFIFVIPTSWFYTHCMVSFTWSDILQNDFLIICVFRKKQQYLHSYARNVHINWIKENVSCTDQRSYGKAILLMWLHVNAMLEVNFHEEIQTKQEEILIFRNKSKKLYSIAIPFMCQCERHTESGSS